MQSKEDEMIHRSDQIDKIRQFVNRKPNEESLLHMDEQNGVSPSANRIRAMRSMCDVFAAAYSASNRHLLPHRILTHPS